MKKKKFLVTAIDYSRKYLEDPIHIIVETTCTEDALEMAQQDNPSLDKRYHYTIMQLSNIKRIKEKDITIKEVMQTTFSEEQLIKTIQMYEDMLLKGINFKTLGDIFAPYLIMYDPKLEECIVSKTVTRQNLKDQGRVAGFIMDVGFRFLPRTFRPFNHNDTNFKLWYQKVGNFHGNNFKLILKQGSNGDFKEHTFTDFVLELNKIIPDVPVRLEKVVIENL
jgi:hypothetical protein